MTRSVATRLTLIYLAIIMAMSIAFSFVIYNISSNELRRGARPPGMISLMDDPTRASFEAYRRTELETSRRNLERNLVLLNLGTLVLGALLPMLATNCAHRLPLCRPA
jgi:hypothetical protein